MDFLLYVAALKGLKEKSARKKSKELLEEVGLEAEGRHRIKSFSGGMKRRLGIAQAMLNDPRILILDEPTRGVDVKTKAEIYSLINELAKKGLSIIMVSSELPELINMSDRIVVFSRGYTTGVLERGEFTQENIMTLATMDVN